MTARRTPASDPTARRTAASEPTASDPAASRTTASDRAALDIQAYRLRLPGTARPVLAGVDLTVAAGETVALVGSPAPARASPPAASSDCCRRAPPPRAPCASAARTS
ncbi:hypothetical protein ACFQ0M_40465 [Kitasatospora aburaviensis]